MSGSWAGEATPVLSWQSTTLFKLFHGMLVKSGLFQLPVTIKCTTIWGGEEGLGCEAFLVSFCIMPCLFKYLFFYFSDCHWVLWSLLALSDGIQGPCRLTPPQQWQQR